MSKYEFKPFHNSEYLSDLADGWLPTYRVLTEYPEATPRELEIFDLGPKAQYKNRIVSIDLNEGGDVRHHDERGMFDLKGGTCCLDVIMYREAKPKVEPIRGVAYVSEKGQVVTVSPDYYDQEAANCRAVRCTITLHDEPA